MHFTHALMLIVLIVAIAGLWRARCRSRAAVDPGPSPRGGALRGELRDLGQRVAVLERIADDEPVSRSLVADRR